MSEINYKFQLLGLCFAIGGTSALIIGLILGESIPFFPIFLLALSWAVVFKYNLAFKDLLNKYKNG